MVEPALFTGTNEALAVGKQHQIVVHFNVCSGGLRVKFLSGNLFAFTTDQPIIEFILMAIHGLYNQLIALR